MTQVELASLFNVTGMAVVLVVSLFVASRHPEPFFKHWTRAYMAGTTGMTANLAELSTGSPAPLTLLVLTLHFTTVWQFLQTAHLLRGAQPWRARTYMGSLGAVLAIGAALLAAGLPYQAPIVLTLLADSAALIYLGSLLLGRRTAYAPNSAPWLGTPLILLGLWPLTYPLTVTTPFFWVGYWVAGVLHLLVGIGMVVLLLEEAAQRLSRQNDELQALDRLKNNFLHTVSHELRTPLTAVSASAGVLDEEISGPLSSPQREMVGIIVTHTQRLGRLIGDILDYARLEAGKMRFAKIETDLVELLESTVASYMPAFRERDIALTLTTEGELLTKLDPDRVTQVVANLFSNALKFTPAGGTVSVSARREGEAVVVRVTDTGPGVPAGQHERIFQRFHQADGSLTREAGGAGLGLAICKGIIEDGHGGKLWLAHGGPGATFAFMLPAL